MKYSKERPYVLFVAEVIYSEIARIKKKDPSLSIIDAVDAFIGSETYNHISSGKFHEEWLKELKQNDFIDKNTKKKIPVETIKLLNMQKALGIASVVLLMLNIAFKDIMLF